jgi:hypothetical protein
MAEHGAKAVRDRVANLLIADLPFRVDAMTELWLLDDREIPKPGKVTSGEAPDNAIDHQAETWIEVIAPRLMPRTRAMGLNADGQMIYRYRYSARIYIWTLADRWQDALNRRDRLSTAARDSLLTYPTLAIPPAVGDTGFLVNSTTMSEEFAEPHRIGGRAGGSPRVRAAGLLAYEIEHEYATGIPSTTAAWGVFDDLELAVTLLPYTAPIGGPPHVD